MWPSTPIPTSNLNNGDDSPAAARPDLLATVQAVNAMQTERLPTTQGGIPTGAGMDYFLSTAPTGWIFAVGTIGSATSGATNRANADCHDLFVGLWNSMADAQAPVSGGRGASAEADWSANKTIAVPDKRGRVTAGRDDMGGTAAGVLNVTLNGTTTSGSAVITGLSSTSGLAIGMAAIGSNIPSGRTIASIDSATQVTLNSGTSVTAGTASIRFGIVDGATLGAAGGAQVHTLTTPQMPAHTHSMTGFTNRNTSSGGSEMIVSTGGSSTWTSTSTGGGQAHPNVQPTLISNYIIKL